MTPISPVAYTFSKTVDKGTRYFNQFDQRSHRGPSQLDQPHHLALSGTWTPLFHPLDGFIVAADRPISLVSFLHVVTVTLFDAVAQGMYDSAASSTGWKWPIKLDLKRPQ